MSQWSQLRASEEVDFQLGILLLTLDKKEVLLAVAFWFELVPLMASWLGEPVDASSNPLMITAPCHNYNQ